MEMRINSELLKQERSKRAWSQEHLAQVTGLGLRTIQRIESTGLASNESIAAIATAFEATVSDFLPRELAETGKKSGGILQDKRLLVAFVLAVLANLVSPPQFTVALACLWLWVALELSIFVKTRIQSA